MTPTNRKILVGLILLLAIFGRFWHITTMPGGLFPDQAANGEDAISILHGHMQPFYERGNGREALFFYLQAVLIAIFGVGVWPMFFASALVGTATVYFTYAAGRRMFGDLVGVLAGLFIATNQWHISLSRTGFRAITIPLFLALVTYFFMGIFQAKNARVRLWQAIGCGVSFGLGWYTYIAFRAFVGVIIIVAIVLLLQSLLRKPRFFGFKMYRASIVALFLSTVITMTPLFVYFNNNPGSFAGRSGQVSILNPDINKGNLLGTATDVLEKSILAFFTAGDINPRHNVPGLPFLSPIPAVLGLIGIIVALVRSIQYLHRLLRGRHTGQTLAFFIMLLLLAIMLVPAVATAEGIPHGLRSIGEIPVVFWLAGIGGAWFIHRLKRLPSYGARRIAIGTLLILFALTAVYDLSLYFGVSASLPKYWYEYRSDLTTVSNYLNQRARLNSGKSYLVLDDFSVQTVHFLTTNYNYPYLLLKPKTCESTNIQPGDVIVFTQSTIPDAERYQENHPKVEELMRTKNQFDQTTMIVYGLKP
jgi:4-amino-4-deoxy-L-arabinose transferase-like glycosyltransferase